MSTKGQKMLHERRMQAGLDAPTELDRANAQRKEQWMESSRDAPKGEEIGWLIERGPAQAPTYLWADDMGFKWTFNVNDAVRFARRADAEQVACIIGDDAHRIAEHMWMASSEPPLATPPSPPPRERERALEEAFKVLREVSRVPWGGREAFDWWDRRMDAIKAVDAAALAQPPAPPGRRGDTCSQESVGTFCTPFKHHPECHYAKGGTPLDVPSLKDPAPPSVSAGRGEIERVRDLLQRIQVAKEQKGRAKDRHAKRAAAWAALRDEINAALSTPPATNQQADAAISRDWTALTAVVEDREREIERLRDALRFERSRLIAKGESHGAIDAALSRAPEGTAPEGEK